MDDGLMKLKAALAARVAQAEAAVDAAGAKVGAAKAECKSLEDQMALLVVRMTEAAASLAEAEQEANRLDAEWTASMLDLEAVERTMALVASSLPPTASPPPTPAPAPATDPGMPFGVVECRPANEAYTDAIMSLMKRNPESTKQWSAEEVRDAVAKRWGVAPGPLVMKNVRQSLIRLVARNELRVRDNEARGKTVYSLH